MVWRLAEQFHRRRNQSPTDNELAVRGKIGYLGLDVYEEEERIFFGDRSGLILSDDVFARLLTFPNVIITGHQAFFTREALLNIAGTTIENITRFEQGQALGNHLTG
jgi:D-lactate dehydrogenase